MEVSQLQQLSDKIDRLINKCKQLEADNHALRELQEEWQQERMQLLQKNDLARSKIEAMISRLKALEQR
ncbi:TIGR02449 family protein [Hahella sp. CCB-MM4]|uniref:TIGR02449 family protein n=1 Tax=Hahella sp. (strain CCB-MM4) TaxID=1926491 RepID=UPI000B9A303C|nr:TIGR02449 family protein [Hahella sp. CCB-MM4]OZG74905.1 TIGR02449 family protein [Hahella sp. CCB-MM4]